MYNPEDQVNETYEEEPEVEYEYKKEGIIFYKFYSV